jgi:hypothetical protein
MAPLVELQPRPEPHFRRLLRRSRGHVARALVPLALLLVSLTLGAGTADAHWGPHGECSTTSHCYAVEEWNMKGYPTEYADGAALDLVPEYIDVTESFEAEAFVSMEMWVGFGGGTWIETGQVAGPPYGCCSLHRFYASWGHEKELNYWESPEESLVDAESWSEIWDPSQTGEGWGIWWGGAGNGAGTLVAADSGYPAFSDETDVGMEVSQGHSKPYASGRDEIASVEPPTNYWTELKSAFGHHSEMNVDGGMCAARNPYSDHWGNIQWTTCQPVGGGAVPAGAAKAGAKDATPVISSGEATKIALEYAEAQSGEPVNPEEISVAEGSLATNQAIMDPSGNGSVKAAPQTAKWLESPTILVSMRGNFKLGQIPSPRESEAPSGSVLAVVLSAETGHVERVGLGSTPLVSGELEAVPDPALTASRERAQAASARGVIAGVMDIAGSKPSKEVISAPARDAKIVVRAKDGKAVGSTRTNADGHFSLHVRPGSYTVLGESAPRRTCSVKARVQSQRTTHVHLTCFLP